MISVRLEAISKSYRLAKRREVCALKAIDCSIFAGEILSIIGPSGSGKSSLLRIIAGIEEPTRGQVRLDGMDVMTIQPARREIAIVFQDALLYPNLNAFENLALILKRRNSSRHEIESEITKIAVRFRISDCLDALPEQLSQGQRQRIALARALLLRPRLLLLDEPLASLDPQLRYCIKREIVDWQLASRATTIFVTHDPYDAWTMGNRIAVMESGRLLQLDTPETIRRAPLNTFVAGFLEYPPMNLLKGRLIHRSDKLRFESDLEKGTPFLSFDVSKTLKKLDTKRVIAGIAPNDFCIQKTDLPKGRLMKIFRIEEFGDCLYAEFREGCQVTIARLPNDKCFCQGEIVNVNVKSEKVIWFDAKSKRRLE